jgi:penicillin-insensitive murein endopeptidase
MAGYRIPPGPQAEEIMGRFSLEDGTSARMLHAPPGPIDGYTGRGLPAGFHTIAYHWQPPPEGVPVQDQRGFFYLPQLAADMGYYNYGTPRVGDNHGPSQYAHPKAISVIVRVASHWREIDNRRFGVGNISMANGSPWPDDDHQTHRSGLEVDVRPLRRDGREDMGVHWHGTDAYDRAATSRLIRLFLETDDVRRILFNDPQLVARFPGRVQRAPHHDDHLHVDIRP